MPAGTQAHTHCRKAGGDVLAASLLPKVGKKRKEEGMLRGTKVKMQQKRGFPPSCTTTNYHESGFYKHSNVFFFKYLKACVICATIFSIFCMIAAASHGRNKLFLKKWKKTADFNSTLNAYNAFCVHFKWLDRSDGI